MKVAAFPDMPRGTKRANLRDLLDAVEFVPLADLSAVEQTRLRDFRNQPLVRRNSYTNHQITPTEHRAWITRMTQSANARFFGALLNGQLVGGINLYDIDAVNFRADWGLFVDGAAEGIGIGPAVEFRFLDYAFGALGLRKLNCDVLACNASGLRLQRKFGFIQEGIRCARVIRDGEPIDAHIFGLTARGWADRRAVLLQGAFR